MFRQKIAIMKETYNAKFYGHNNIMTNTSIYMYASFEND